MLVAEAEINSNASHHRKAAGPSGRAVYDSLAGIGGSNTAGGCMSVFVSGVFSGRGLCDGPIPSPEEYYRVCMCVYQ